MSRTYNDFQRYLSAKKSVDDRALNQHVWQSLHAALCIQSEPAAPLRVIEIGAGIGTMVERMDIGLEDKTDPEFVGLWLEVLAEAARNCEIARIVQTADQKMRERVTRLEEIARRSRCIESQIKPEAVAEVIMALLEGLGNRIVQNPDMDKEEVIKVLRVAAQAILQA